MSVQKEEITQVPTSLADTIVHLQGLLSEVSGALSTISNMYNALVQTKMEREKEIESMKVEKKTFEKATNNVVKPKRSFK